MNVRMRPGVRTGMAPLLCIITACGSGSGPSGDDDTSANAVPGTIEAEDFDKGGQGVAYHDNTPGNSGGAVRPDEDVDIVASEQNGSGFAVSDFEGGEWLAYTITVPVTAAYDIEVSAASDSDGSAFHVEIDGEDVSGSVPIPNTGALTAYETVPAKSIWLTAGRHTMKIFSDEASFRMNSVRIRSSSNPESGELLFESGFEDGVRLEAPGDCFDTGCWQPVRGTDQSTGFGWPPAVLDGDAAVQLLVDAPVTEATVGEFMRAEIRSVAGPDGAQTRALYSEILKSGCCGTEPQGGGATQIPLQLLLAKSPGDLYVSFWLRFQPDLEEVMASETWRSFFNMKTGTPAQNDGDYRITAYVRTDRGIDSPYWSCEGDNVAGGDYPLINEFASIKQDLPIPVGEWFKFEAFVHRSSAEDGRVWMAVDGTVICDRSGPNTGAGSLPVNRIMMPNLYSGSAYPISQYVDDIQIWSGFPTSDDDPPYAPH